MLFRPHRPIYIGKFQVPFTPGLIPKRRDELAVQLGKMVVEHLLTPEGIGKKLTNEKLQKGLIHWAQVEVDKVMTNEQSLRHMLGKMECSACRRRSDSKNRTCDYRKNLCIFSRVLYIYMGTGFTSFCT